MCINNDLLYGPFFSPFQSGLVCGCIGEIVDRGITGVIVCDPNIPEPGILRVTITATTNKDFNVNITASNTRTMSSNIFESSEFSGHVCMSKCRVVYY